VRPPGTCDAPYASAAGVADVTSSVPAAPARGEGGSMERRVRALLSAMCSAAAASESVIAEHNSSARDLIGGGPGVGYRPDQPKGPFNLQGC